MALNDFDFFNSQGDGQFILEVITPLVSTGSGKLVLPTGGHGNAGSDGGLYTRGLDMVRYETLAYVAVSGIATAPARFGITVMQSHHNLNNTSKSFYFFGIENAGANFASGEYVLYKTTNGWGSVAPVPNTNAVAIVGSVYQDLRCLRIDCITDTANLGGVWLKGYAGVTDDFSDLTQIFNVVDYTSPITTTVNEGIAVDAAGTGSTLEVWFDQVSLYPIT